MSSWVCPDETINRIVTYLYHQIDSRDSIIGKIKEITGLDVRHFDEAEKFGFLLRELNLRGTGQRYDTDRTKTMNDFGVKEYGGFRELEASKVQVLKSIHCLHYQCAEGDTDEQPLFKLLDEICDILANDIVMSSPEYDKAKWE